MQKHLLLVFFSLLVLICYSQPGTEVYLMDLTEVSGLNVNNPRNISQNPGYDNQPSFTNDGYLLYTSFREGNMDIVKYSMETGEKTYWTSTKSGEYSPIQMPSGESFSTITLEENGRQLLWAYSLSQRGEGEILIPYLKIGYHVWRNENELFAFVLGPHPTLQWIDLDQTRAEVITDDIGRSLHIIPGTSSLSYIKKLEESWMVRQYLPEQDSTIDLTVAQPESEDMCWYDEDTFLMGKGSALYSWNREEGWQMISDLSKWNLSGITRMAVSPDQKWLAIVVDEPAD